MNRFLVGLALSASPFLASAAPTVVTAGDRGGDPFHTVYTRTARLTVQVPVGTAGHSIQFSLPQGITQGGNGWYVVDLALQVSFSSSAANAAPSEVAVLTDNHLAAAIDFFRDDSYRRSGVRWSTGELFTGPASGFMIATSATLHFRNFLQVLGVHGGKNTLRLQLTQFGKGIVRTATLLPGSRIAYSPLGPPALRVSAATAASRVRAGTAISVHYHVTDLGLPATEVGLVAGSSGPGAVVEGPPSRYLGGWLLDNQGVLRFQMLIPGRYQLTVGARGQTGGAANATVSVEVIPAPLR